MARAEMSIVINCPAPEIFAYMTDVAKGKEWQDDLVEAQQTSTGPMSVGTTIREVRQLMGKRLESVFKITEHEPGRKLSFESTSGPIPLRGHYTLETVAAGTHVTMVIEAELTGVLKMTEPLVVHTAKRQLEASLTKLKALLESRA